MDAGGNPRGTASRYAPSRDILHAELPVTDANDGAVTSRGSARDCRLAPRTGGFWKLLLLGLGQAAEQLPRLGFELTDEREVTLGVPV
jgi:hypothetical protein